MVEQHRIPDLPLRFMIFVKHELEPLKYPVGFAAMLPHFRVKTRPSQF
jgi:hypothetical protein